MPMRDDRFSGPRRPDRPFSGGPPGPRHPAPRPPAPRPPDTSPIHTIRLRDGDVEFEVTGSAGFVRQALDDMAQLMTRLRGQPAVSRPATISLPPPRPSTDVAEALPVPDRREESTGDDEELGERVMEVLRDAHEPLAVAEIRRELRDPQVSGQQIRRLLERHPDVVANDDRPATYRLR